VGSLVVHKMLGHEFDCEGDRCRGCGVVSDPFGSEEEKDDETVSRKVSISHGEK